MTHNQDIVYQTITDPERYHLGDDCRRIRKHKERGEIKPVNLEQIKHEYEVCKFCLKDAEKS